MIKYSSVPTEDNFRISLLFQITGLLTFVQFVVIQQPRRGGNNDGNMAYIAPV